MQNDKVFVKWRGIKDEKLSDNSTKIAYVSIFELCSSSVYSKFTIEHTLEQEKKHYYIGGSGLMLLETFVLFMNTVSKYSTGSAQALLRSKVLYICKT